MGKKQEQFKAFAGKCPYRLTTDREENARNRNCLRVDAIGQTGFTPRCSKKTPSHWPESATALRWLGSGGSITVFGFCSVNTCALGHRWCESCGHREDSHGQHGCLVDDAGWPCGCETFIPHARVTESKLSIADAVRRMCKSVPGCGYRQISARVVAELLKPTHLRLDGDTGNYIVRSVLDDGVYGRGKTPVNAVAEACQLYPMFRNEVLGNSFRVAE